MHGSPPASVQRRARAARRADRARISIQANATVPQPHRSTARSQHADHARPSHPIPRDTALAKPNYNFEKRQREIAKKKQQDEKQAKKRAARESSKPADTAPEPPADPQ